MVDVPESSVLRNTPAAEVQESPKNPEETPTDSHLTNSDTNQRLRRSLDGQIPLDPTSYTPATGHSNSEPNLSSQPASPSHCLAERPNQGGIVHEYRLSQAALGPRPTSAGSTPVRRFKQSNQLRILQDSQNSIPQITSGPQTPPHIAAVRGYFPFAAFEDFRHGEDSTISKVILVLHDHGANEISLRNFADQHLRQPDTLYILLRGIHSMADGGGRFHWADNVDDPNGSFVVASSKILELICQVLIKGSNISPSQILLFGEGQGGMAALSVAAAWNEVEFGGVISIGGLIPDHFPLPHPGKPNIRTPSLVIGGELGDVNATAKARIKSMIMHVDVYLEDGTADHLPNTPREIAILQEFLEHRLRKTEWMKPSVLTLGMQEDSRFIEAS
jgi:predicted esterase